MYRVVPTAEVSLEDARLKRDARAEPQFELDPLMAYYVQSAMAQPYAGNYVRSPFAGAGSRWLIGVSTSTITSVVLSTTTSRSVVTCSTSTSFNTC